MNKKVLIADDCEGIIEIISEYFGMYGYLIHTASTLSELHYQTSKEKYDLIVLDYRFDKDETSRDFIFNNASSGETNSETPIFLITADITKIELSEIAPFLKRAFLKPFKLDSVVEEIAKENLISA